MDAVANVVPDRLRLQVRDFELSVRRKRKGAQGPRPAESLTCIRYPTERVRAAFLPHRSEVTQVERNRFDLSAEFAGMRKVFERDVATQHAEVVDEQPWRLRIRFGLRLGGGRRRK